VSSKHIHIYGWIDGTSTCPLDLRQSYKWSKISHTVIFSNFFFTQKYSSIMLKSKMHKTLY